MILRVDPPEAQPIPGPTLIAVPNLAKVGDREESDREGSTARLSERFSGLWELADSGASPLTISKATGVPVGRVELILGLRRKVSSPMFDEGVPE
jgi:hypothetical protein